MYQGQSRSSGLFFPLTPTVPCCSE